MARKIDHISSIVFLCQKAMLAVNRHQALYLYLRCLGQPHRGQRSRRRRRCRSGSKPPPLPRLLLRCRNRALLPQFPLLLTPSGVDSSMRMTFNILAQTVIWKVLISTFIVLTIRLIVSIQQGIVCK